MLMLWMIHLTTQIVNLFCCRYIYLALIIEEDKICDKAWRAQKAHDHRPMFTGSKKVEPILCVSPWQNEGPDLPTKFQKTCSARRRLALEGWGLLCKEETCPARRRLALQGWGLLCKDETYSTRRRLALQGEDLLYKERRQDLTTIKRPQHPHKKVRVTNSSLAL